MSGNPWALPDPIALLLIVFGGVAAAATLVGYVITTAVRRRFPAAPGVRTLGRPPPPDGRDGRRR
jgi:hypothetical protein